MPNCCVPDCKNSSAKGYLLKCFPKNEKRRAQWIENINRPDWIPNHCHRVCEAHFAPNMWEKTRVDGSRKLKFNAIPTIFDHTSDKPFVDLTAKDSDDDNHGVPDDASIKEVILPNNQTLIKIITSGNLTNLQSAPIFVPASSLFKGQIISPKSAIIVNSQGKVINSQACPIISGATSILKTQVKTTIAQSSPMMISTNPSILKNQIRASNSQKPIIIPSNTSILKSQVQTAKSQLTSINLTNVIQDKSEMSQPILVPVLEKVVEHELPDPSSQIASTIEMETVEMELLESEEVDSEPNLNQDDFEEYISEPEDSSEQKSSVANSTGIILNKAQAKKLEDERFEKMDKLLLKQLKLNNALRKKLNLMNHKMQQLVKEQNNDCKAFLRNVFTDDQIRALELRHTNPKSVTAWSHKTMLKAIKLKQVCGTRGYEELLTQNLPLPSIRTICRWCTTRNIPIP